MVALSCIPISKPNTYLTAYRTIIFSSVLCKFVEYMVKIALIGFSKQIYLFLATYLAFEGPRALHPLQVTFIRLFAIRNVSQGLSLTLKGLLFPSISLHSYLDFHFFSISHSLKLYLISFLSPLFSSYFSF